MQKLFKKYLENQCTPEEVKELLAYFSDAENEAVLRGFITDALENDTAAGDERQWKLASDKTFAEIKKRLNPEKKTTVPILGQVWFRVAASVLFLVGVFTLYDFAKNSNQKKEVFSNATPTLEIGPGSNKAVLTLADGSTILLETAANGTLAQQGNTEISKSAAGQLVYTSLNENPTEVLFNSITTPRGGEYQLLLPDGSKVWLNAASSLRFPASFAGGERKVELTGEAYFEVAKNASQPFKVEIAGKSEIEVLGTQFNVNAYSDEATVNTTLLEGRVKVKVPATQESQTINPGEQANVQGNGQIAIRKVADAEQAVAWRNGAFHFSNAELTDVFRQLSRWYDVDIKFEGEVPQRKFSGEMQRNFKLSQVLKVLERNNVLCRLEGKTLVIQK
jgi:transmembrane sensor